MAGTPPPIEPVELRAGDLLLRPWREEDADAYWAALEFPGGRLWHGSTLGTRDDVVATLARRRDWTIGDHASWALVDGAELLGSISVHRIDREQDDGEIGYWIAPSAAAADWPGSPPRRRAAGRSPTWACTGSSSSTRSRTWPRRAWRRRPGSPARAGCASRTATATACGTTSCSGRASPRTDRQHRVAGGGRHPDRVRQQAAAGRTWHVDRPGGETAMLGGRRTGRRMERQGGGPRAVQGAQRLMSIGDDYWIEDGGGRRVYKIDGKALRLRKTLIFEDADEHSSHDQGAGPAGQGFDGDRGRRRAPHRDGEEGAGRSAAGAVGRPCRGRPDLEIRATWWTRVHVHDGRTPVATVSKKWFGSPTPRAGLSLAGPRRTVSAQNR